uniref:Uncharacterized protein n=1 Tax=Romanomermis culicivorax TaxID=13658 RepID=A0A915KNB4_ROMCU
MRGFTMPFGEEHSEVLDTRRLGCRDNSQLS